MIQVYAIVIKELKTILRDPVSLAMLFLLPSVFIVVLSIALQGAFSSEDRGEKIDIILVDEDSGELGEKITHALVKSGRFRVLTEIEGQNASHDLVVDAILKGRFRVAVEIPPGSSEALLFETDRKIKILTDPVLSREFAHAIEGIIRDIAYMAIVGATLEKHDQERKILANQLAALTAGIGQDGEQISRAEDEREFEYDYLCQSNNYAAERGLQVEQEYLSVGDEEHTPSSVQQNVPGWTIFALFWIAQLISLNIVAERLSGAYKRILISSLSMTQYVVGKTIPFVLINLLQAVFMFSIGVYLLPLLGCEQLYVENLAAIALITVTISLVSNGFGLFMASISKNETFVASLAAAVLIILCIVGGIMVPKFVMPSYMQRLSMYVPHGWAMEGYQNVLVKGYSTEQIIPHVLVLFVFGVTFFAIGIVRLKKISFAD